MTSLTPGANLPLTARSPLLTVSQPAGANADISAFVLYAGGKVRGDDDMCFFNQTSVAGGAVTTTRGSDTDTSFALLLDQLPADVEKIAITATLDARSFDGVGDLEITCENGPSMTVPTLGRSEKALILAEVYRRGDDWKIRNVSQGFNGGLAALATHFGVDVANDGQEAEPVPQKRTVDLAKRILKLEKEAPALVSLVKSVGVNLEKRGSPVPAAKVCLCLDISGSMTRLFSSGKIDKLVERALALGLTFDDDGEIDVFLFGKDTHEYGTVNGTNYQGFSARALKEHPLEGGTRYGKAMGAIRQFYAPDFKDGLPVFVFFVTDGSTDYKLVTLKHLKESADEPIFWKYMGLIQEGFFSSNRTSFLQDLDDLPGRTVDNADFFNVADPSSPAPDEFYDEVIDEFPEWMAAARDAGILS